jgi:hypothetical protein
MSLENIAKYSEYVLASYKINNILLSESAVTMKGCGYVKYRKKHILKIKTCKLVKIRLSRNKIKKYRLYFVSFPWSLSNKTTNYN